jgi:hypothetical protein
VQAQDIDFARSGFTGGTVPGTTTFTGEVLGRAAADFTTVADGFTGFPTYGWGFNTNSQNTHYVSNGAALLEVGAFTGADGIAIFGSGAVALLYRGVDLILQQFAPNGQGMAALEKEVV